MEALANMLMVVYLPGERDGGDRSQGTIYPALFAQVSKPDELLRNIQTVLICGND